MEVLATRYHAILPPQDLLPHSVATTHKELFNKSAFASIYCMIPKPCSANWIMTFLYMGFSLAQIIRVSKHFTGMSEVKGHEHVFISKGGSFWEMFLAPQS